MTFNKTGAFPFFNIQTSVWLSGPSLGFMVSLRFILWAVSGRSETFSGGEGSLIEGLYTL